ncbi:cupin domain-containing protein [Adlercreutzia sp. R21]|uniref:Cupin domain-containing protein n=1 Tax=Adlercreutzia wanghongyangiae TaxID=3111451 RepID=A0ABU6IHR1_9ACTN|nr:cupin domain-containing protein [Adlercreutzia sp. R21]MEC4175965.1 cupin domain-containing protein [Adlercreutzia sp. R7]MEC4184049.1 cupin domain-containing protein [Adlercreutzia sp. R21]
MEEENLKDLGERLQGLREACDVSRHTMAEELGVDIETYRAWEETGVDIPISAIYHMARKFNVDLTEILTGTAPKLDTYHLVRHGETEEVERFPGYHYEDMASRYARKIMQPLLVVLDPCDAPAELVCHDGQEFNYVLEGSLILTFGDRDIQLNAGDSIYFNPTYPHGQRCNGTEPCKFITIIAE